MPPKIDRRLYALQTAKRCAAFGARVRTIARCDRLAATRVAAPAIPGPVQRAARACPRLAGSGTTAPTFSEPSGGIDRHCALPSVRSTKVCPPRTPLLGAYARHRGICQVPQGSASIAPSTSPRTRKVDGSQPPEASRSSCALPATANTSPPTAHCPGPTRTARSASWSAP